MATIKNAGRWLVLLLALAALYTVDFYGLGWNEAMLAAPWALLAMTAVDVTALALLLWRLQGSGWRLATAVGLLFFGLKTVLVAVEAVYLPDVLPPSLLPPLLVNGAVTAVIFALLAVGVNGRWSGPSPAALSTPTFTAGGWLLRLLLAGFGWMVLFVATGLLVFSPVANALDADVAAAYLAAFAPDNPILILLFQWGRGVLWALLALPVLRSLRGGVWQRGLLLGLCFAGWMASGLLLPNDLLPAAIWPAHLAEVAVENLLFGLLLVRLLTPRRVAGPARAKMAV